MRLHSHTLLYISVAMFFIIGIWASVFYIKMLDEIYDSIDDNLKNFKSIIIKKSKNDSTLFSKINFDESNYSIQKIPTEIAKIKKDIYMDTLMYLETEQEVEPVRLLKTVFTLNHVDYYELKIISSMVEEEDLIKNLFGYI
jgi:hypothetical protein